MTPIVKPSRRVLGMVFCCGVLLLSACSGDSGEAVRTGAPAEDGKPSAALTYFLFDPASQVDQATADVGGGSLPCCASATGLFAGPNGESLRIDVAAVEGATEAPEDGAKSLTVSVGEHAAIGTTSWSDGLIVSLVLTGVPSDQAEDELARLAGALEVTEDDPQVAGLTLSKSSGYTEIARRRSDASMRSGRGGAVHTNGLGGDGGASIEFREAPYSQEHVELNLAGLTTGFVDAVGERRVLFAEATARTPASAWFLEEGYLVSVTSQVDLDQLRKLVNQVTAASSDDWKDVRARLAEAARAGEVLFLAQADGLEVEVFATPDVPMICLSRAGETSCEQALSVAPTIGAVALGGDAWVVGYSEDPMDSVALNGDSADVDKADSVDWFIASIPTGSSPASLRVGDYEQEIARPAT